MPDRVQVPNVIGLTYRDAEQALRILGLTVSYKTPVLPCPPEAPNGWVAYTTPAPGSLLLNLSVVNLTMTCGNQ